jgi:hypothetical protein
MQPLQLFERALGGAKLLCRWVVVVQFLQAAERRRGLCEPIAQKMELALEHRAPLALVLDRLVHLFDAVSEAFDWGVKYTGGLLGVKGLLELIADGRAQCFSLGVLSREFSGRAAPRCKEGAPAAVTVRIVEGAGSKDAYERRE